MRGAGYDVLGRIEGAACASGTVQVGRNVHSAPPCTLWWLHFCSSMHTCICKPHVESLCAEPICYGHW